MALFGNPIPELDHPLLALSFEPRLLDEVYSIFYLNVDCLADPSLSTSAMKECDCDNELWIGAGSQKIEAPSLSCSEITTEEGSESSLAPPRPDIGCRNTVDRGGPSLETAGIRGGDFRKTFF